MFGKLVFISVLSPWGGGQYSSGKGFGLPLGWMFWKFLELFCYCKKVIYYRLLKCHCGNVQIRYNDVTMALPVLIQKYQVFAMYVQKIWSKFLH